MFETATLLSVVDARQWRRIIKSKGTPEPLERRRKCETNNFENDYDYETEVTKLNDIIYKSLEADARKQHTSRRSHINAIEVYGEAKLESIAGPDERVTHPANVKKEK